MVSTQNFQYGNGDIYFYIPMNAVGIFQNSICLYNDKAEILDCLNMEDFKEQLGLTWDQPSFTTIKHITKNLYAVAYVSDEIFFSVYLNNAHWIIMDDFFNIKKEYPVIEMSKNVESSIFESDANVNMHDIIINEDLTYAIIIVSEKQRIKGIKDHFPSSKWNEATVVVDALCVQDLKTGKEIAALSADGIFVEYNKWWEYITEVPESYLYLSSAFPPIYEVPYLDLTHINAMNLVEGSHFSSKYENERLFLIGSKSYDTMYLLKWDFLNHSSDAEIIWMLPSMGSPAVIKNAWYHKWEYVNDPFYGVSDSHDLNIFNLPKGHIALLDNGSNHRASITPGKLCPMTRSVEYKIEMDIDGKKGFNRITLVYSYPKVSDYPPEIVNYEVAPNYYRSDCEEFWEYYNYQYALGSFRKTKNEEYVISNYYLELFTTATVDECARMVRINSDGDVLYRWSVLEGQTLSYRINPLDINLFRNGIYAWNYDGNVKRIVT